MLGANGLLASNVIAATTRRCAGVTYDCDKAVCWGYLRLCSRVSGAECDKAVCWGYLALCSMVSGADCELDSTDWCVCTGLSTLPSQQWPWIMWRNYLLFFFLV